MLTPDQQLDALYAELPELDCRGACWDSCGRINMTGLEHARTERAGVSIPAGRLSDPPSVCPALTMLHQCSVYAVRPMICRLWGIVESMPCSAGCRPKDGRPLLTDRQTYEYLARAHDIAGEPEAAEQFRRPWREDPELADQIMLAARRQRDNEQLVRDVRRRAMAESGKPMLFVRGRGHISSEPPASGANAL